MPWPWRCLILSPELPCCRITNYPVYPPNCDRDGLQSLTREDGSRTTARSKFNSGLEKHSRQGTSTPGSGESNEHPHQRVMCRGIVLNSSFVFTFVNLILKLRLSLKALCPRRLSEAPVSGIVLGSSSLHPSLKLSNLTFDRNKIARNNTTSEVGCLLFSGKKPLDGRYNVVKFLEGRNRGTQDL